MPKKLAQPREYSKLYARVSTPWFLFGCGYLIDIRLDLPYTRNCATSRHDKYMSSCEVLSTFTMLTWSAGTGLVVLGLIIVANLLIKERGERLKMEPAG